MGVITDKLGADLKQQKDIHTFLENDGLYNEVRHLEK